MKKFFNVLGQILLLIDAILLILIGMYCWKIMTSDWAVDICEDWRPDMSESESIRLALEIANSLDSVPIDRSNDEEFGGIGGSQIPYDNVDEILEKYPNCCRVSTPDEPTGVRLTYPVKLKKERRTTGQVEMIVDFSVCIPGSP